VILDTRERAGPTARGLLAGCLPIALPAPTLDFKLPRRLEAGEPPEARGLARDQVRLMVSYLDGSPLRHTRFDRLTEVLGPGDLLVVNTSGTLNAALPARREDGLPLELHLSTHLPARLWVIELRQPTPDGALPYFTAAPGERVALPAGGSATLLTSYRCDQRSPLTANSRRRLWIAELSFPLDFHTYLQTYGFPIRYPYVRETWPASYYQTVFASEPGSAEMPSAGRAFTNAMVTRLIAQGVQFAPLVLHTGVASLENDEPPYEEYYRVPAATAGQVNRAMTDGRRIIAVGTTVVRALETVTSPDRQTHPGEGWTDLVVTPERGIWSANGLLTGFHEPRSTHLAMLAALAGSEHLRHCYGEALANDYLWHEFGDLHLILPGD
jgi:S-adenosylmethionine:tRNA ribosyltransferase-isomerase